MYLLIVIEKLDCRCIVKNFVKHCFEEKLDIKCLLNIHYMHFNLFEGRSSIKDVKNLLNFFFEERLDIKYKLRRCMYFNKHCSNREVEF